jgi:hypothetical protein
MQVPPVTQSMSVSQRRSVGQFPQSALVVHGA